MKGQRVAKWLAIGFIVLGIFAVTAGGIVYARVLSDQPASATSIAELDTERGVLIAAVEIEGPAAQAGVVRGDILLAIDSEPVNTFADLRDQLAELEVGDAVQLTILHGDEERELRATLDDRDGGPYLGIVPCGGCRAPFASLGEFGGKLPFDLDELPFMRDPNAMPQLMGLAEGALIVTVVEDGPAAKAGLQEDDRITAVDGQALDAENDLADLISSQKPGDATTLTVERSGDESLEITVVLGEHPENTEAAYLGVEYRPAHGTMLRWNQIDPDQQPPFQTPEDRETPFVQPFHIPPGVDMEQGAIVRNVTADSPAEAAGLNEGDVITAIDGESVAGPQAVVDAVVEHKPGDVVTLSVVSSDIDGERLVEVTLAEHPEDAERAYLGVAIGGFFRQWHSNEDGDVEWQAPLKEFMEKFQGEHGLFAPGEDFEFHWRPGGPMRDLPFNFDFELPPGLFEEAPAVPGEGTL